MTAKRILIADDEPHIIRSLSFVLERAGYDVSSAADGEEALASALSAKPHIMFLDIMMPKKNGYDVCREIKASNQLQDIHVIMLSAKGQESDRLMGMDAGADEFITKPFSPAEIVSRVKEIFG